MTRKEAVFNVINPLTKAGYTDDSRIDPDYVGFLIDKYRAKEIRDSYNRHPMVDPIWLQDMGIMDMTDVNYADDKTFSFLNCKLAKVTLPPTVSFYNALASENNLGVFSIRAVSGRQEYFYRSYPKFLDILQELPATHTLTKFSYYTKVLNAIYAKNADGSTPKKIHPILILEKPLDGYVLTTENVSVLTIGTIYEVVSGQIIHNLIPYNSGDTFTAVTKLFTGTGLVQYVNQKRRMTNNDPYPFSEAQMDIVIMKILTQEYGIEATKAADLRNDSQDSTKAVDAAK